MKYYHLAIVFLLATSSLKAQFVTIPDAAFISWISNSSLLSGCITGNQLDTTCAGVTSLKTMIIINQGITDLTGITYFDSLLDLRCSNNLLSTLPMLPPNLQFLECRSAGLDSLPGLPQSLTYLNVSQNQLSELPTIPVSLTELHVQSNQLAVLPPLPFGLEILFCADNSIDSLPALPSALKFLNCAINNLTALPSLPSLLTKLQCYNNNITALPALPPLLDTLQCYNNQLTSLPSLPSALYYLDCHANLLDSIPELPLMLNGLDCSENSIIEFPVFPPNLFAFLCVGCNLIQSPVFPMSLQLLDIRDNPLLTSLSPLNDSMYWIDISNTGLSCLPLITHISQTLYWEYTNITCMPAYLDPISVNPPIDTVPICDLMNPNGCPFSWNISGDVHLDDSADCIKGNDEGYVRSIPIILLQNGVPVQQTYTNKNGFYTFNVDTGAFEIMVDTNINQAFVACPAGNLYQVSITPFDSISPNCDFGVRCNGDYDFGVSSVVPFTYLRPGSHSDVFISAGDMSQLMSLDCPSGIGGNVIIEINGPVVFDSIIFSGNLIPAMNINQLIYSVSDFDSVNSNQDFNFALYIDTTAQAGDQVCIHITVNSTTGDLHPFNDSATFCFTVVNSYDPNDKQVSPEGIIDTTQEWLTYTIRFQNTGNAPAQHIYILDTLDPNIDESSIQLLSYSHEPMVQVVGNVVRFNFPNINLPDSVNDEPNSHGYVQYKVKLNQGLPLGTEINNTAYIYFDFNPPVQTNTVTNTIDVISAVSEIKSTATLHVYPNPVKSGSTLHLVSKEKSSDLLSIYDITGRVVYSSKATLIPGNVELPLLSPGIYQIMVVANGGIFKEKVIVQ